jgi:hypothetical protein
MHAIDASSAYRCNRGFGDLSRPYSRSAGTERSHIGACSGRPLGAPHPARARSVSTSRFGS